MKRLLLAALMGAPFFSMAQHSGVVDVFRQLENMSPYYSLLMEEYTHDINQDLNRSFMLNLQTGAAVMDTGEFTIGIVAGAGQGEIHSVGFDSPVMNDPNIAVIGSRAPTVFNGVTNPMLTFTFIDEEKGTPLFNPNTGEPLTFELQAPGGLDLPTAVTPSTAVTLGYGFGYGTEVRAYITPKFGAAVSAVSDDVSFSNDFAYGLSVKHDIATWIPSLHDKGWHLALDVAYSHFGAKTSANFVGVESFDVDFSDDYAVEVENTFSSLSYNLSTMGTRVFVGKSFSWIDFSAYAGVLSNSYEMSTEGGFEATLIDKSGNNPDEVLTIDGLSDFSGSATSFAYGVSTTIGTGWFRTSLAYTRADRNFVSLGFHFYL
ncbi:MAG: hypothetical protein HWE14_10200 [Flavobacteriia bacterium]|nr:hypothetical protein [Flavobacteriia bacterium]